MEVRRLIATVFTILIPPPEDSEPWVAQSRTTNTHSDLDSFASLGTRRRKAASYKLFHEGFSREYFLGYLLSQSPPIRKPLPRVRKPNLHSDRGQDSNQCAWRSPRTPKHAF
ncbi:hypothetical protein E2C01_042460 [Portunus trituberculatus]|uniref:Uncharacterized protein n=1 Tax=Portunus trituberculatus TaxID=210409 RepID=A0A5B7FTQ8_PORTR|nr:hypothetical protein [Portunus trituberculatus]